METLLITGVVVTIAQLFFIILKLRKMSEINDKLLAEAQKTADSLKKIRTDIATLTAGVNPVGGLTEEEANTLLAKLQAISADAADVDAQTPDPASQEPTPDQAPQA